jgi:hypothetical protein
MSKARVFFSTGDRMFEIVSCMCVDQHASKEQAEKYLSESKADYIKRKEPDPEYWDKLRIFKVTVEEVQRTTARKRRAGGKR